MQCPQSAILMAGYYKARNTKTPLRIGKEHENIKPFIDCVKGFFLYLFFYPVACMISDCLPTVPLLQLLGDEIADCTLSLPQQSRPDCVATPIRYGQYSG